MTKPRHRRRGDGKDASSVAETIRLLELPDCDCPRDPLPCDCQEARDKGLCDCPVRLPPPCRHILSADHSLPIERWAMLLALARPDEYREPPPPPMPSLVLRRKVRVELMRQRRQAGFGLWHPRDIAVSGDAHLAFEAGRTKNGRPVQKRIIANHGGSAA